MHVSPNVAALTPLNLLSFNLRCMEATTVRSPFVVRAQSGIRRPRSSFAIALCYASSEGRRNLALPPNQALVPSERWPVVGEDKPRTSGGP
eukprot:1945548-Pyramimonas_sp.AAC.1